MSPASSLPPPPSSDSSGSPNSIAAVFSLLDQDNDGYLSPAEVDAALEILGVKEVLPNLEVTDDAPMSLSQFDSLLRQLPGIRVSGTSPHSRFTFALEDGNDDHVFPGVSIVDMESESILSKPKKLSIIQMLLSGAIAGATAKTTIAPLDRVKILYQVSRTKKFSISRAMSDLKTIWQEEGLLGLWRGNSATMLRVVPYAAIQYTAFENLKWMWFGVLNQCDEAISPLSRFCIGAMAGAISVSATYPFDLLRARLAVMDGRGPRIGSLVRIANSSYRSGGVKSLFSGIQATLLGIVPYAGLSFGTFETLKSQWLENCDDSELRTHTRLFFGGTAGLLAQSATYPLDIVRRRMQVHGSVTDRSARVCSGVVDSMITIMREEGLKGGLYKGLSLNWIKGPLAVGISFTVFDSIKAFLLRDGATGWD